MQQAAHRHEMLRMEGVDLCLMKTLGGLHVAGAPSPYCL